jgi:hypothetical protein
MCTYQERPSNDEIRRQMARLRQEYPDQYEQQMKEDPRLAYIVNTPDCHTRYEDLPRNSLLSIDHRPSIEEIEYTISLLNDIK